MLGNLKRHIAFLLPAAVIIMTCLAASSCSLKKNTAATRRYQAFITRYNIYYNGDTHYRNTLQDMETAYEDDYSRILLMHPAEAKGNNALPQPQGDFNRSIEKGQKAIQLRSIKQRPARKGGNLTPEQKAWYKRDEYNPFLHNAWMLMGRGQYFNGDFAGAASTFFYISKHFTWLPNTVVEAQLWQARSYIAMGWLFEAEVIISHIKPDQLVNSDLQGLYDFVKADYLIKNGQYADAVPFLQGAIKAASGAQKTRLRFLLGQIYARLGMLPEAYAAYGAAAGSQSASYRTKFNARIKQSEVFSGSDIAPEVKSLRRMLHYGRNKEYVDQIYYAIGNLYLSRADTVHAIDNYILSIDKSTRGGIDKALAQLTLGGLYFARHQYSLAQPCYAGAMSQLTKEYPGYETYKRRSDVLDELAVFAQNVELQDSLLHLSSLSEPERLAVVNRIIEDLKRKEREEAEAAAREEFLNNRAANGDQNQAGSAAAPTTFNINTDNSWYFYNTATRNAGKTEFQRRWGARKLEDHWRRRNKSEFNTGDFSTESDESATVDSATVANDSVKAPSDEEVARRNDPHNPEYYLAQIPVTDEQKATSHQVIQEGLYNMGIILKDKLEDYPAARSEWNRLLRDYPDNEYRLDVFYNLYLMGMREGDEAAASVYRDSILTAFGDTDLGRAIANPAYLDNLRNMDSAVEQLYNDTYQAYLANDNAAVHAAYATVSEKYPLAKPMPKFMFLHALAYMTEKDHDSFNAVLRDLLDRYPSTDLTPVASAWLKGMAQGRNISSEGSGNLRGMIWDMRLTNDSTPSVDGAAPFTLDPTARQLLALTFDLGEVNANALLYEVARHNFKTYNVRDYDLELLSFGRLGIIVIRDFDGLNELNDYRSLMASSSDFRLPQGVRPIAISVDNFKLLTDQGRSFDEYFRFLQEQNYVDTQEHILQPEEVETLPEADAAAETQTVAPTPPVALPQPQSSPTAPLPSFDPGSEGDDPLFD